MNETCFGETKKNSKKKNEQCGRKKILEMLQKVVVEGKRKIKHDHKQKQFKQKRKTTTTTNQK